MNDLTHRHQEQVHDHQHQHGAAPVNGTSQPAPTSAPAQGTVYTCPMHPQIRQPAPGNCPICGMTLEPVLPSLEECENPELADFRHRFWWTLPLTVVATLMAMFGHRLVHGGLPQQSWFELLLTTPVIPWAGWPF